MRTPKRSRSADASPAALTRRSVRGWFGGVLDPFESGTDKLAATYDCDLFRAMKLSGLKSGPRVYFNSPNLATGNLFFFTAGGGKPEEIGDHELGTTLAPDFPVSRAVAASSAFPPVFPPLRLDPDVYPPGNAVEYVTLTDGGVYDNTGVNPLLRMARNALDYMIVSDGGKPFNINERPTESGAIVLKAGLDIMMEQIRGLEFDRIEHRHLANKGPKPLWFSIDSKIGEKQHGDASFASSIGTNLKKLSDEEMTVLARHGSSLLAARIDQYAPELKAIGP
jgi:NTE family protein